MRKRFFILYCLVFLFGCATLGGNGPVNLADGVTKKEAIRIARITLSASSHGDTYDPQKVQVVSGRETQCLTQHWLVLFNDKNIFWQNRLYYVVVDKSTGDTVRGGVVWKSGNYWSEMLSSIDECK